MFQIIKFCGITAEQVAALDKVLKSDAVKSASDEYCFQIPPGGWAMGRVTFAQKLQVKSDGATYLYEIKVLGTVTVFGDKGTTEDSKEGPPIILSCPIHLLATIFGAVGLRTPEAPRRAPRRASGRS